MRSGHDRGLLVHLQVPADEVTVTLPDPWRKVTPWREGLTSAVFTRSADRGVAIRTVSVPTGSLDFDLDAELDVGACPEDLEPGPRWVEVGPGVAVDSGCGAVDSYVGQPIVRIDLDFASGRFLKAIRAPVERAAVAGARPRRSSERLDRHASARMPGRPPRPPSAGMRGTEGVASLNQVRANPWWPSNLSDTERAIALTR